MVETILTCLTVNDVYDIVPNERGCGGIAELANLLKQEQESSALSCVTINGDFLSASHAAVEYEGSHMIQLLNELEIDYAVLGNHEFDFGLDVLQTRISESKFKWLGSNVKHVNGGLLSGVLDIDLIKCPSSGITFGIFGLCTQETPSISFPGDQVTFEPILPIATEAIELLKQKGAQVIIAMTHLSIAHDKLLAKKVPGIDLIIGGHDHQPFTIFQGETMIHKSGQNAYWLGRIDLHVEIDSEGQVAVHPSWKMLLNRNITPEPRIQSVVTKLLAQVSNDAVEDQVLAVTTSALDTRASTVRCQESHFGLMVADALCHVMQTDFGLINGGFLRGDKLYREKTQLTVGTIQKEMPFPRPALSMRLRGKEFKQAVKEHLGKYPELSGSFPHLSGLRVVYDSSLKEFTTFEATSDGKEIEPERLYSVAITTFIASGGDGCTSWQKGTTIETGDQVSKLVMDYLSKTRIVEITETENRLVIV